MHVIARCRLVRLQLTIPSRRCICCLFAACSLIPVSIFDDDSLTSSLLNQIGVDFANIGFSVIDGYTAARTGCYYALHPLLVGFIWPNAWRQTRRNKARVPGEGWAGASWRVLTEPDVYRPLISVIYLLLFLFVIAPNDFQSDFYRSTWAYPFYVVSRMLIFASLMHLAPTRRTYAVALGETALVQFIMFATVVQKFVDSKLLVPDRIMPPVGAPAAGLTTFLATLLVTATSILSCSFSFGLSSSLAVPTWAVSHCAWLQRIGPLRLPLLRFPCGLTAFLLAWLINLAIPALWPLPDPFHAPMWYLGGPSPPAS